MDTKEKKRRSAPRGKAAQKTKPKRPAAETKTAKAPEPQRRRTTTQPEQKASETRRRRTGAQPKKKTSETRRSRTTAQPEQKAPETRRSRTGTQKQARPAASRPVDPDRRRRTGTPNTPDREERQRRVQNRRQEQAKNPTGNQRVIRPPREEIPPVLYRPPKPMRRGRFLWKLVSMAAVVAAVFLALSVFFRVETIVVAGAEKYTPWMIRQAAGVEPGDALLSISDAKVASRIRMELPYVDEIKVGIRLPGTVEIEITELQVAYSIEDENGAWWLISATGRAVEQVTLEKALGYTRIEGLSIRTPQPAQQIQALPGQLINSDDGTAVTLDQEQADEQLAALISVMTGLENNRIIGEVTQINVTDVSDIRLEYPQLLTVLLGDSQRMDYKISYLAAAMQNLSDSQSGVLDLSLQYAENAIFTADR